MQLDTRNCRQALGGRAHPPGEPEYIKWPYHSHRNRSLLRVPKAARQGTGMVGRETGVRLCRVLQRGTCDRGRFGRDKAVVRYRPAGETGSGRVRCECHDGDTAGPRRRDMHARRIRDHGIHGERNKESETEAEEAGRGRETRNWRRRRGWGEGAYNCQTLDDGKAPSMLERVY